MTRIAVFASGNGSNAENLILRLTRGEVVLLLCNNPAAYVLKRAQQAGVPAVLFSREELESPEREHSVLGLLREHRVDLIILAGFLWKIPAHLIRAYPGKIVNIHPALLPKYGGPGMYGDRVHKAVLDHRETSTGITVHIVDELYDHGRVIFQATCKVDPADTPDSLAQKVHELEHMYFPGVIDDYIKQAGL